MTLDLDAIRARYDRAIEAKPSKGAYTADGIAAITDSVCDVPELLKALKAARDDLAKVHEMAEAISDHFGDEWLCTPACQGEPGCPLCVILAITGDDAASIAWREGEDR